MSLLKEANGLTVGGQVAFHEIADPLCVCARAPCTKNQYKNFFSIQAKTCYSGARCRLRPRIRNSLNKELPKQ